VEHRVPILALIHPMMAAVEAVEVDQPTLDLQLQKKQVLIILDLVVEREMVVMEYF